MSELINISNKISSATTNSYLAFNYDFDIISKPKFYNSDAYNSLNPIIKQVFKTQIVNQPINTDPIQNLDFMTYMFPTSNKIQLCTNNLKQFNTYTTKYLHFTTCCPIKIDDTDIPFSIIIECESNSVQPLLIVIPVKTASRDSADTNADLDLLIKYSQVDPESTYPIQNDNIYVNNIIPLTGTFLYFNQTINTPLNNCDIVLFNTTVKTLFSIDSKDNTTPQKEFSSISNKVTSLIKPSNITYDKFTTILYVSSIGPLNSPVIIENDIYIYCSVLEDSTTNKSLKKIKKKKKNNNTGLIIIMVFIIFISSLTIYFWIYNPQDTKITSRPPAANIPPSAIPPA